MLEREQPDGGGAVRERGLAIGQVELPGAHEARVETERAPAGQRLREALPPVPERVRVVATEREAVDDAQPGLAGQLREARGARQHSAREHVLLDEVRAPAVASEQRLVDGDRLDDRAAAGLQATPQGLEVRRPVALADGLEHLDRDDAVVAAGFVAVVAQREARAFVVAGALDARARPLELLGRQREAGYRQTALRRELGEGAPAAANLQHA